MNYWYSVWLTLLETDQDFVLAIPSVWNMILVPGLHSSLPYNTPLFGKEDFRFTKTKTENFTFPSRSLRMTQSLRTGPLLLQCLTPRPIYFTSWNYRTIQCPLI